MPREKECYRIVLERLDAAFPNKAILSISDVSKYTGRSREWVRKKLIDQNVPKKDTKRIGGIGKEKLASLLS